MVEPLFIKSIPSLQPRRYVSPFYARSVARRLRCSSDKETILNVRVPVICVASFSMVSPTRPSFATQNNMESALWFWEHAQTEKPLIVFGSCSHAFGGAHLWEERMKTEMCARYGARCLPCGPILNSVDEMRVWRKKLSEVQGIPSRMLISTCEMHSKSELLLSRMVFPETSTYIWANSHELEVQKDHPTDDQASWPRWTYCSLLRYCVFKSASVMPQKQQQRLLDRLQSIHHKPGKLKVNP